eukprot:PhM_4_TR5312/c0_g1_i1/m.81901
MEGKERPVKVHVIKKGTSPDASPSSLFNTTTISVDMQRDTALTIKSKLRMGGFLVYFGAIPTEGAPVCEWYVMSDCPIVAINMGDVYVESEDSAASGNDLLRLLNAGLPIQHALTALSRAYWHTGFHEFSEAATMCKRLVQSMIDEGTEYHNRSEFACVSTTLKILNNVGVFAEASLPGEEPRLLWPPSMQGKLGEYANEWFEPVRPKMGMEEQRDVVRHWEWTEKTATPALQKLSRSVVRVFGYHPRDDGRFCIVPFTAFFVAPTLLMCPRTCAYSTENKTYAARFAFTHRVRALHGMLRPDVDLFPCTDVREVRDTIMNVIRNIGVEIPEDKLPPSFMACPWSDLMLLRVDPAHANETYVLPSPTPLRPGDRVYAIGHHTGPTPAWTEQCFGEQGYGIADVAKMKEDLLTHMWRYDIQCCSEGVVKECLDDLGTVTHTATLLPSSRGSLICTVSGDAEDDAVYFHGVALGRSDREIALTRDEITQNSIGDVSRREALSGNVFNTAMRTTHVCLVLVYQNFVLKELRDAVARHRVEAFLRPYDILVKSDLLHMCHRKMLKDADDANEYGTQLWEGKALDNALYCYREGARMFSIASIPNQSEYELKLKDALQSNVSAVVVAKMRA